MGQKAAAKVSSLLFGWILYQKLPKGKAFGGAGPEMKARGTPEVRKAFWKPRKVLRNLLSQHVHPLAF